MKTWQRIAAVVGAMLGGLFYMESSTPILPDWLLIGLNIPGILPLLAPVLLTGDAYTISDQYISLLLPVTNALAYWLLVVAIHRMLTRRWSRAAISVAVLLVLVALAGFGLHQYRQHLDDAIQASWNPESRIFDWGRGSISVPEGFTYEKESGHDSLVGKFNSDDAMFEIDFDIGELAAEHGIVRGSLETLRNGSRVFARRHHDEGGVLAAVTLPDNGCANFLAWTSDEAKLEGLDSIVRSFQPHNQLPAWIQPWLPDLIRSECRIRSLF